MSSNVVLLGEGPLFWEVRDYLNEYPVQIYTMNDSIPQEVAVVIDVMMEGSRKKELLKKISSEFSKVVPIYTCSLHHTATQVASWLTNPSRVLGFSPLHFDRMKRMEVSLPLQYEKEFLGQDLLFFKEIGKDIEIVGDEPGLVFPRVLALIINEAVFSLSKDIAEKEDIDLAMKKGTNYPLGPLEWADEIGIDVILSILSGLHRELGEEKYRPAPLLRKMVYAGYLGQVSSKGFYTYQRTSALVEW